MKTKKNHYKIAVLMKSEVRKINHQYTAGCERVFLQDTNFFLSKKFLTNSYTACEEISVNNKMKNKVKKLFYPRKIIDQLEQKCLKDNIIISKIYFSLFKIISKFADIFYVIQFIVKEKNTNYYYVFEHPLVALFFPKKTILTFHNFESNHKSIVSTKILLSTMKLVNSKNKIDIIFVSHSLKDQFANIFDKYSRFIKYHIIYNGVDSSSFNYSSKPNLKTIKFIYPSVWMKQKGINLIPRIVRKINKSFQNKVEFLICGSSDLWSLPDLIYKKYARLTNEINLLQTKFSNVTIQKASHGKMNSYYKESTFTLLPSVWKEPFSLSVIESLACGTPVIAFNVGGTAEIVKNRQNGYLVNKLTERSYTTQLIKIISSFNQTEYKQMSINAKLSVSGLNLIKRNKKLLGIIDNKIQ